MQIFGVVSPVIVTVVSVVAMVGDTSKIAPVVCVVRILAGLKSDRKNPFRSTNEMLVVISFAI